EVAAEPKAQPELAAASENDQTSTISLATPAPDPALAPSPSVAHGAKRGVEPAEAAPALDSPIQSPALTITSKRTEPAPVQATLNNPSQIGEALNSAGNEPSPVENSASHSVADFPGSNAPSTEHKPAEQTATDQTKPIPIAMFSAALDVVPQS